MSHDFIEIPGNPKNSYYYDKLTDSFECQYTTSMQAGNTDFHMHDGYEIYMLLDGNIHYFVEQTCYFMTAGSLIVFSSHEIHKATNLLTTPFTRLVLHLNPAFVRQYCTANTNLLSCIQNRKNGRGNMITLSPDHAKSYHDMFQKLRSASTSAEFGHDVMAVSFLMQLLVFANKHFYQSAPVRHTVVYKSQPIMNFIDRHLCEPLTLEMISKNLNMDKYYISHLFKKETESTIFQYILVKRIALAKELLVHGLSVTEVCQQSGFNDYSNFIRSFRQITGYTPGQFKKRSFEPTGQ